MRHLQSKIEGTWKEIIQVTLTEEQENFIKSSKVSNKEKKSFMLEINSQTEIELSSEDQLIAETTYLANKPELKKDDTYELIEIDMTLENGLTRGILNCRINGEHKQIRF